MGAGANVTREHSRHHAGDSASLEPNRKAPGKNPKASLIFGEIPDLETFRLPSGSKVFKANLGLWNYSKNV